MQRGIILMLLGLLLSWTTHAQNKDQTDTADFFIPLVTLDQLDSESDDGGSYSLLSASYGAFESATIFTLGRFRYRFRGYDGRYNEFQLNYMPLNDMILGWFSYSTLGGLSNILYGRNNSNGLEVNNLGIGGVGGLQSVDIRAGNQRKGFRGTYSFTNGSYNHRLMATYNTGYLDKGWAISVSMNKRWAQEGYIDGTFYDGHAYYVGVEKLINAKNRLALSVIGNNTRRGRSSGTTQEVYDLAGSSFYNSYWGYQEGVKRNARVSKIHQPLVFLNYEFNNIENLVWRTSAFTQFGRNGTTALNWFDAADPRPDYYRNLPSYEDDPSVAAAVEADILNDPNQLQLDWAEMYEANYNSQETVEDVNGVEGSSVSGRLARYLVEERRFDNLRFGISNSFEYKAADNLTLQGGINWQRQKTRYFKVATDLLGAEFHVDLNQFADRDFPNDEIAAQNDLNNPNRVVNEGDDFGYDYDAVVCETGAWMQALINFEHIDMDISAGIRHNHFFRDSRYRYGIFPDNSFGKSEKQQFVLYDFKAVLTYKLSGKHYLYASGKTQSKAPTFRDALISPRTRNAFVPDLKAERIHSFEGGYLLKSPDFKARAVVYYTGFKDRAQNISFYNDDLNTFVNYSIRDINTGHVGAEFMFEAKIIPGLYASIVGVTGRHIYKDRATATITRDNDAEVLVADETVYWDNFYVGGHQSHAATLGIDYRSPKFWRVGVDVNYLNGVWISVNPARRTENAVELVEEDTPEWRNIIDQEKTEKAFTLDLSGGYSWKMNKTIDGMKKNWYMYLNVGLNNVLNKRDIRTGGYEQYRYDFEEKDPETFPRRYYYAYGFSAYVNLTFRL